MPKLFPLHDALEDSASFEERSSSHFIEIIEEVDDDVGNDQNDENHPTTATPTEQPLPQEEVETARQVENQDNPIASSSTQEQSPKQPQDTPVDTVTVDSSSKETRAVLVLRIAFGVVLVLCTVFVAIVVYHFTSRVETNEFELQYWSDAEKIKQSIGSALRTTMASADSLSSSIVAHKQNQQQLLQQYNATSPFPSGFPFVALPHYPLHTAKLKALSKSYSSGVELLVTEEQRKDWEAFAAANSQFVQEGWELQKQDEAFQGSLETFPQIIDQLFTNVPNLTIRPEGSGPYLVSWQKYPIIYESNSAPYNYDLFSFELLAASRRSVLETKRPTVTGFSTVTDPNEPLDVMNQIVVDYVKKLIPADENPAEPIIQLIYPILDTTTSLSLTEEELDDATIVGMTSYGIFWRELLRDILPASDETHDGILVVTENTCGQVFTYQINGGTTFYMGNQDYADSDTYRLLELKFTLGELVEDSLFKASGRYYHGIPYLEAACPITVRIYPSEMNESLHSTSQPLTLTICAVSIFVFAGLLFVAYNVLVERRQRTVAERAAKSSAIVSEMFPKELHGRLFDSHTTVDKNSINNISEPSTYSDGSPSEQTQRRSNNSKKKNKGSSGSSSSWTVPANRSGRRKSSTASAEFSLEEANNKSSTLTMAEGQNGSEAPVADFYPSVTVFYSDIVGFAEWSARREMEGKSAQVFALLETLFRAFDTLAEEHDVYKVETVHDSYIAVAGVPKAREDHAVAMACFATCCRDKSAEILNDLLPADDENSNSTLTASNQSSNRCHERLLMRFGLHSGPVTGGVLRGQRSRFQLFGDTTVTVSKIVSSTEGGQVQASKATADLLCEAGKDRWVAKRPDLVDLSDGKGPVELFHINAKSADTISTLSNATSISPYAETEIPPERFLSWSEECLGALLKKVLLSSRKDGSGLGATSRLPSPGWQLDTVMEDEGEDELAITTQNRMGATGVIASNGGDREHSMLSLVLKRQLRAYLHTIQALFVDNEFHNFEHAFHVARAMDRLLREVDIKIDPVAQFAGVLSALISDVDHPGIPNELVRGKVKFADGYKGRSVTQHIAFEAAWKQFLEPKYSELRQALAPTEEGLARLRRLILSCVNATDIMNPGISAARKERWDKTFGEKKTQKDLPAGSTNSTTDRLITTVVLEHLMLCAYLNHTMQPWGVYQVWNEMLFREMYKAYTEGRVNRDPYPSWYQNELGLFDKVVVPLAEKLSAALQVDGSLVAFAKRNRDLWEKNGKLKVEEMKLKFKIHPS